MKKFIITSLKIGISVALIVYLVWDAKQGKDGVNVFANLRDQDKNWLMLAGAWAFCTAAVLLTFVRWWYLVRALDVPCRFADAIRISFWGYLFNLAPLGIVGGDLVKAVMLAHQHPQYRAKAVASVLFDRLIGLYLLFIVASSAILLTGFWDIQVEKIHSICYVTFIITAVGTVGFGLMFVPGVLDGRFAQALGRLPRVGHTIAGLIEAVALYRRKPIVLLVSSAISVGVHCLFATGIYLIARGLPGDVLSLSSHFVIWPLSSAVGVFPLPLGPTEFVLDSLYTLVPQVGVTIPKGQGLVVALCYRFITLLIAALGIFYYVGNRREVVDVIHDNQHTSLPSIA